MCFRVCLIVGVVCLAAGASAMKMLTPEDLPIADQISFTEEWHEALLSGDQKRIDAARHNAQKVSKAVWNKVSRHDDNRHGLVHVNH